MRRLWSLAIPRGSRGILPTPPPPPGLRPQKPVEAVTPPGFASPIEEKLKSQSLTAEALVPWIPTFFVPAEELGEIGPGYTIEHLERYFVKTGALQIVTIDRQKYVRLHGNNGHFDMKTSHKTNERFSKYKPSLDIADQFLRWLRKPNEWLELSELLERTDSSVREQLPFLGPAAITYFAQNMHLFNFALEPTPRVTRNMKPNLTHAMSPTPILVNQVLRLLRADPLELHLVERQIDEASTDEMKEVFGSWKAMAVDHRGCMGFKEEGGKQMLMSKNTEKRLSLQEKPVQEQLKELYKDPAWNKTKIRKLERRLIREADPDNPNLDRGTLVKTIQSYIPENSFIDLEVLLKNLPREVKALLPQNHLKFFRGAPYAYQLFEYKRPNHWHIARPDQPLPEGYLKNDYSEAELLQLAVDILRTNSRHTLSLGLLSTLMPGGARETVKRDYGNLVYLIAKFPKNFALSQPMADLDIKDASTVVTLISPPLVASMRRR